LLGYADLPEVLRDTAKTHSRRRCATVSSDYSGNS
jgi:hypothetical protein